MTKILFYSDIGFFGGHEAMTLEAAKWLSRKPGLEVSFMYSQANNRLAKILKDAVENGFPLRLHPVPQTSSTFQEFRSFLAVAEIRDLQARMTAIQPDLVVAAQTRIEVSTMGVLAASRLGIPTYSYLALAHPLKVSGGGGLASALRDHMNDYYYGIPNKFITVSNSMKELIAKRAPKTEIAAVYNGIDSKRYAFYDKEEARASLGFSKADTIVGLIGRIQFKHKAQDLFVRALAENRDKLGNMRAIIVGDGPDKSKLYELLRNTDICSHVVLHPWSADISRIYSALDMLVIPSWFEGLPLVMLEAMHYSLPIVASHADAMKELLPPEWLFETGNGAAMVDTLQRVLHEDNRDFILRNKQRVDQEFQMERFLEEFSKALGY